MTSPASEKQPVLSASTSTPGEAMLDDTVLSIRGNWTLLDYQHLQKVVSAASAKPLENVKVDIANLGRLDTAGAFLLVSLIGPERLDALASQPNILSPEKSALLSAVCSAMANRPDPVSPRVSVATRFLAEAGQSTEGIFQLLKTLNGFIGQGIIKLHISPLLEI